MVPPYHSCFTCSDCGIIFLIIYYGDNTMKSSPQRLINHLTYFIGFSRTPTAFKLESCSISLLLGQLYTYCIAILCGGLAYLLADIDSFERAQR